MMIKHTLKSKHNDVHLFKFGNALFGQPQMFVYVYFIDGLLIDSGHPNMRREICSALEGLKVEQMVITHHHEDHSGNVDVVQSQFQCPVFSSKLCMEIMKSPPPISPAQWVTWGKYNSTEILEPIGDRLETPNYNFNIIEIPGHARDMIALHDPNQGIIFSADLYVYHRIKYFMRSESMAQQIKSIKRVLELNFDQMYCSHNPVLDDDPKDKLIQKLRFFEDFYGKTANLYHKGLSARAIFKKLELKESWSIKINSLGALSTLNMVKSVIRDEQEGQ